MLQKAPVSKRKPINLSIDSSLVREAKSLNVNMSRAAEKGIAKAVAAEKARQWKIENSEAIDNLNEYVRANGIPLAEFQQF